MARALVIAMASTENKKAAIIAAFLSVFAGTYAANVNLAPPAGLEPATQ